MRQKIALLCLDTPCVVSLCLCFDSASLVSGIELRGGNERSVLLNINSTRCLDRQKEKEEDQQPGTEKSETHFYTEGPVDLRRCPGE